MLLSLRHSASRAPAGDTAWKLPSPRRGTGPSAPAEYSAPGHAFSRISVHPVAPGTLQRALEVGGAHDEAEAEARRVADAVMGAPSAAAAPAGPDGGGDVLRPLRDAAPVAAEAGGSVPGETAAAISGMRGAGRPLPAEERGFFEPRLGHDLGGVRVHDGAAAAGAARAVGAAAFTVGSDVFFGGGRWAPGTDAGRRLLAHELAHVVQQGTSAAAPVLRRAPDPPAAADPEKVLGERLLAEFPNGISMAFYQADNAEAERMAKHWAGREKALGVRGSKVRIDKLEFGRALADDTFEPRFMLPQIGPLLTAAVAKARPAGAPLPEPGMGPDRVRVLALFAHGMTDWCGIGEGGFDPHEVRKLARAIEPTVTRDVNVLLYACNNARGQSEDEEWRTGTMQGGGADSLAGQLRDHLVDLGAERTTVWGHTTTGHPTGNSALRVFSGADGAGTAGVAYAGERVFTAAHRADAVADLKSHLAAQGFDPADLATPRAEKTLQALVETALYDAYRNANTKLRFDGEKLAMMAPMHPEAVADVIRAHWRDTFWPARRPVAAAKFVALRKPKKLPAAAPATPAPAGP